MALKKYDVIFADLDGTLINTVSGATFPKGIWDTHLNFRLLQGLKKVKPKVILIVTNQGGIEKGFIKHEEFETKLEFIRLSIQSYTGIPTYADFCSSNDPNYPTRKPNIGMLEGLINEAIADGVISKDRKPSCLMIGDASGKPGQFSDSDKRTAFNYGCDYLDVEDFATKYLKFINLD